MGRNNDDKTLIKETYAASLQPERLAIFEEFWETYIESNLLQGNADDIIDDEFLQSHFSMALGIVERIRHEKEEESYFQRLVMSHAGLAFILAENGLIVSTNSDAQDIFEGKKSLHNLPLNDADVNALLNWCRNFKSREKEKASPYLFKSISWGNQTRATLMLAPINPPQLLHDKSKKLMQHYLVARIDLEVSDAALPTIQEHYSLTPAEAKVAMYLANGRSTKQTAELRSTSVQTVRTQIKKILAKTNTRDIADLVRLMLSLGGKFNSVTSQTERLESANLQDHIVRRYNLILPDGRFMEYVEQGHPKGTPVLQMHSVTNGVVLTNDAAQKAVLKKWRFITPSRAGYGNSDPNPTRSPKSNVDAAVEDFKNLLDHLGIESCHILSGWAGCFSQAFAIKYPTRVKGIVQTGSVPIWHAKHLEYMKPRHRIILKTSLYAPAVAPYMLRVAKALIDSGKSHLFVAELERSNQFDLETLRENSHLYDIIADGHKHNLRQGTEAFVADLKTVHKNWIDESAKLTVPITVLRGEKNSDQPDSTFEEYQSVVPHAKIKRVEGAGAYLYLTHFGRVLEELKLLG